MVFTRLKRLPSPAIVISVIALFVALGGSVYAASNISGKTIKKGSLPGNRLKKNTVTGKQVKESSLGAVPNATNATNAANAANAANATGLAGPLASGQTLVGYVDSSGHVNPGEISPETSISFQIPLATAPALNVIPVGGPSTGACPGTDANPSAAAGNLCIYESRIVGTTGFALSDGASPGGVTRFGVFGLLGASGNGDFIARGTWAVTAP